MFYYTGIGSRKTPIQTLLIMHHIATILSRNGWILRSGAADGADNAFETGSKLCDIYLPWRGFNGHPSTLHTPQPSAYLMAAANHPAWHYCKQGARNLHARNCHQVLGDDLTTPSNMLICWTPGGQLIGGTATAIRLAETHSIPVFNLAICDKEHILDFAQTCSNSS